MNLIEYFIQEREKYLDKIMNNYKERYVDALFWDIDIVTFNDCLCYIMAKRT